MYVKRRRSFAMRANTASKKAPGWVLFVCVRTHILIEKTGGAKRPFFEGEGVQNALFSLKGGAKFTAQKRGGGAK